MKCYITTVAFISHCIGVYIKVIRDCSILNGKVDKKLTFVFIILRGEELEVNGCVRDHFNRFQVIWLTCWYLFFKRIKLKQHL